MAGRLLVLLAGAALMLGLSDNAFAQHSPGSQVHPATGLVFPADIAGARMTGWNDYGKSGQPALGFSYQYVQPGRLSGTIYVYTANQHPPTGADNPVVAAQFDQAYREIEKVARDTGRYQNLTRISGPAICRYGAIAFRCATFSAAVAGHPLFTNVMMTGYRQHFVKLRLDWSREYTGGLQGDADFDRFVEAMVAALFR
jgi:hypothetical protein